MAPTLWNRVAMGFSGNRRKRFRPDLRENPQETSTPAVTGKRRGVASPKAARDRRSGRPRRAAW